MIRRVVFALLVGGFAAGSASAQVASGPVYPTPQMPPIPAAADNPPPPPTPVVANRSADQNKAAQPKRVIGQANPPARRASSLNDSTTRLDPLSSGGRFANPGGVGRYAEYYTSNTPTSQLDLHAMPPVRFDRGGGPDRSAQVAAFQAGQQRTRNIQNNINAYGRPYGAYGAGFGFGFGLATGGLYGGGIR